MSFGDPSKTCCPVCNEACQNLLREASRQVIREANIPANIGEVCKGSKANPGALMCLVTKQRESRAWVECQQSPSILPLPPHGYNCPPQSPLFTIQVSKTQTEPVPLGSCESIRSCYTATVSAPSSQAPHPQDTAEGPIRACPPLAWCALDAALIGVMFQTAPLNPQNPLL